MECPGCGTANPEGMSFCVKCGKPLVAPPTGETAVMPAAETPAPEPPTPPTPDATAVLPVAGAQAAPGPTPYGAQPVTGPPAGAAYGAHPPPPSAGKGGKAALVIGIIVVLLLCCCVAAGGGGWYWWSQTQKADAPTETTDAGESTASTGAPELTEDQLDAGNLPAGHPDISELGDAFPTADDAVKSVLPEADWVYKLDSDDGTQRSYLIGPPQSEWAGTVVVEEQDGGWVVIDDGTNGDTGQDGGSEDVIGNADEQKAHDTVKAFLGWVLQDDGLEAQKLTVDPFHSDSASAEVSGGGLTDYVITDVTPNSSGGFDVTCTETWYGEPQTYVYKVKKTSAGFRIYDLAPQ